jgi:undecaprenyl diphosphate synthase
MVIVKKYWPEFGREDLSEAVAEYQRRHRRFGAL